MSFKGIAQSIVFLILLPGTLIVFRSVNRVPNVEAAPPSIILAAAADLFPVLGIIVKDFTEKTGIPVRVSYGASGEFALEIRNGAPFDVFLSADSSFPEKLVQEHLANPDTLKIYARGSLVLWSSQGRKTDQAGIKILENASIQRIAIANPRFAPYGQAAISCLGKKKILEDLRRKFVFGNSLAQVAEFVKARTVDAAFLSASQAQMLNGQIKGVWIPLSPGCVPFLAQKMVVLKSSLQWRQARMFESFLLLPGTQRIFRSHGYF